MFISRLLTLLYVLYKIAFNILLVPYYLFKNSKLFIHHYLRNFVDGVINLQLSYGRHIESVDLVGLQALLGGPNPHLHLQFANQFGNINFQEGIAIAYIIQGFKPKALFEIGTFDGFSTYHLAKNSPPDAIVHTLNLPVDHSLSDYAHVYSLVEYHSDTETHERLKESDAAHKVVQHFGNSLEFDFSPFRGRIEFCFIDGGHSYHHLESDTRNAMDILAERGVIVWHDYNVQHRDIRRFLRALSLKHKLYHIEGTRLVIYLKPERTAPGKS